MNTPTTFDLDPDGDPAARPRVTLKKTWWHGTTQPDGETPPQAWHVMVAGCWVGNIEMVDGELMVTLQAGQHD